MTVPSFGEVIQQIIFSLAVRSLPPGVLRPHTC